METAGHLHLHARLDRRRRGRADAPADRAAGLAAGDPRPDRPAPGRRQRGGRGVEGHHAAAARAGRPRPDPPGAADARPHQVRPGRRAWPRAPTSWPTPPDGKPDVLLLATGSEVALCVEAYEQLKAEGIKARVVSMPSWELFDDQPQEYRDSVLPPAVTARVSVEQASTFGWERYVGATRSRHRHDVLRGVGAAEGTAEEVRLSPSRQPGQSWRPCTRRAEWSEPFAIGLSGRVAPPRAERSPDGRP